MSLRCHKRYLYILIVGLIISILLPVLVSASDGFVAYKSKSTSGGAFPKVRYWNSTQAGTYGSEVELPSAGSPIRHLLLKTSPISSKMVLVTISDDGLLDGYVCYINCTDSAYWTVANNFATSIVSSPQRRFDIDFESSTGNAVIVYALTDANVAHDLAYRVLTYGNLNLSNTTQEFLNDVGQGADVSYSWVELERNPDSTSNELALVAFDLTSTDTNAWIWNGTNFTNELALSNFSNTTGNFEALAVQYVHDGSSAIAIGGDGSTGNVTYAVWNSGTWSVVGSFDIDSTDANDLSFIKLKANPVTNDIQAVFLDNGQDLHTGLWNNTLQNFTLTANIDAAIDVSGTRDADFAWAPNGSNGRLVWDTDTTGSTLSSRLCFPFCTSTTTLHNFYNGTGAWLSLFTNWNGTDNSTIIGIRLNSTFHLGSFYYNGTNFTNYGDAALDNSNNISTYESFSFEFLKSMFIPMIITFIPPTDNDSIYINRNWTYVSINVTNTDATCIVNLSGVVYNMTGDGAGFNRSYNITDILSGNYSYFVRCNVSTDYKNSSSRVLFVDTDMPIVTFVSPTFADGFTTQDLTLPINVTTDDNVSFCTLNLSDGVVNTYYNLTGNNVTWSTEIAPVFSGSYSYSVYCTDFAQNIGNSSTRTLTVNIPESGGYVAYRSPASSGVNFPKIRLWNSTNSSSYGSEVELPTAGSPVRYAVLKNSPKSSKIVLITDSDDGYLDSYICFNDCTNSNSWIVSNDFANTSVSTQRRFDFDFETATGNLVLVYATNTTNTSRDLAYRVLDDTSVNFSEYNESYINDTGHLGAVVYTWVEIDRNPIGSSSELAMTAFDLSNSDINAWIWNGTQWTNQVATANIATATGNFEALAVKYVYDGSDLMAVGADNVNGNINFSFWNGSLWSAIGSFDIDGSDTNDVRFITLKANPVTNDIQAVFVDSGSDLATALWNNSLQNWTVTTNIDTTVDVIATRPADFAWLPNGTSGTLVWDTDAAGTTISQRQCSPFCTGTTTTAITYANTGGWITLFRNIVSGTLAKFIGIRSDSLFNIGSFYYNGTNLTNYGDTQLVSTDTLNTYESYSFDYIKNYSDGIMIYFISPTDTNGLVINRTWSFVNITVFPNDASCILTWNSISYDMNNSGTTWFYNKTGLFAGINNYTVTCNNSVVTGTSAIRSVNANTTTNITINLMSPANNTMTNLTSIIFSFNITTNPFRDVVNCSLIANNTVINSTTVSPVDQDTQINISGSLISSPYNWSIQCTADNGGGSASSVSMNLSVQIPSTIYYMSIDDFSGADNEIVLSAGGTQTVYCYAVVSDAYGQSNVRNASATLYYFLNLSSNPDDNSTHYTNSSCMINDTTVNNKTFNCAFNVQYYANNGTWNCNVTIYNNQSVSVSGNLSTVIDPLYAVNLTDGIDFGQSSPFAPSLNVSVNITNFGNMAVNISLLGYAIEIGDNVGMNCSDGTNITITNIRFSTNGTSNFTQKIPLNGSTQYMNLQMPKQINGTVVIMNTTYWQILADPGTSGKICGGYVIFSAEAP